MKLAKIVASIALVIAVAGCATTVGKPYQGEELEPYRHSEKFLVGILPFENASGDGDAEPFTSSLVGLMVTEMDASGRFRVIERERLENLLAESEFSLSDLADSGNAKSIGNLLGVDALCFTNIASVSEETKRATMFIAYVDTQTVEIGMDARIVDVETGEILASAQSSTIKGRKHWVAFGFMKAGGLEEKSTVLNEALQDGVRELVDQLGQKVPRK